MPLTNRFNLPAAIVSAIERDPYTRKADISSTTLIQPPRIFQLRKRHEAEIVEDASDRLWSLIGQIGHKILERADDYEAFHEEVLSINVHGWSVSCGTDSYITKEPIAKMVDGVWNDMGYQDIPPTIQDYKFMKIGTQKFPHPEWDQQLNINAHIWKSHGFHVEKLQVVLIFRDWAKMQSEREGDYPAPVIIKNIPIWNDNEIEQFIKGRVLAHQAASKLPDNQLPFCMADDQWRQPTKWAVMSFRAAKAVKLFKSPEDANAFIEGKTRANNTYYVEIRPGGPLRCTHFCDVRPFCNQFGIESKYEEKKHGLQTGN